MDLSGVGALSRRRFFLAASSVLGLAVCGCSPISTCTLGPLPISDMTYGEVRRCGEEGDDVLRHFAVRLPDDAPSIISDYGTMLGAHRKARVVAHEGIDVAGTEGVTPVLAAMDGVVAAARDVDRGPAGRFVLLHHGMTTQGELATAYGHMFKLAVNAGASVKRGDVLGLVGTTGASAGVPHVHFGVYSGAAFRTERWRPMSDHIDPHLVWHDGPGQVTLFKPGRAYPNRFAATYPVPGRIERAYFDRIARQMG